MTSDDLNEILKDQERQLMAAWMLPNEGPLTEAQRIAAIDNFADYLHRHRITAADVGRQVGHPKATTITELTKHVFRAGSDEHVRKLNMWVEQHARSKAASLGETFVATTKVATNVLSVARLVRENRTMGLLYGPSGIGKTCCALVVQEKFVGSVYIRIIDGYHHRKGLTHALAAKLGVRTPQVGARDALSATQLERIMDILRHSNRLIILDEAGKLNREALDLLRDIHDVCEVPILLIATRDLHRRIEADADVDHGQLYCRFDFVRPLTEGFGNGTGDKALHSLAEIRQLYNQPPVRLSKDAEQYLAGVANALGYGSLRRCKVLLRNAARRARRRLNLAAEEPVTVTADDLEWVERQSRPAAMDQELIEQRRQSAAVSA